MTTSEGNVDYIEDNLFESKAKAMLNVMRPDQKIIQIFNIHSDEIGECEDEKQRLKMN